MYWLVYSPSGHEEKLRPDTFENSQPGPEDPLPSFQRVMSGVEVQAPASHPKISLGPPFPMLTAGVTSHLRIPKYGLPSFLRVESKPKFPVPVAVDLDTLPAPML